MTAAWWSGHAIGLDFETDGPVPEEARIITCNTTRIEPGASPFSLNWLLKPERDIPQGAIDVHGVTTEHAREFGISREAAVSDIVAALAEASPTVPVVGHNVGSYDMTVLDREMRRLGLGLLGIEDGLVALRRDGKTWATFPIIDTLVLDKALDRYRPGKGGRQLEKVAVQYGVPMAEGAAHAADADVIASLRIAWVIAKRCGMANGSAAQYRAFTSLYSGRSRPEDIAVAFTNAARMNLRELHEMQVPWAAEQAVGLAKYFKANPDLGVDPDDVNGDWPFHPYA